MTDNKGYHSGRKARYEVWSGYRRLYATSSLIWAMVVGWVLSLRYGVTTQVDRVDPLSRRSSRRTLKTFFRMKGEH